MIAAAVLFACAFMICLSDAVLLKCYGACKESDESMFLTIVSACGLAVVLQCLLG